MEIERRVLIGFAAGRYPFISGASQPGEGDGAVWFIPESDHKAIRSQAIGELRERLLSDEAVEAAWENLCYVELEEREQIRTALKGALNAAQGESGRCTCFQRGKRCATCWTGMSGCWGPKCLRSASQIASESSSAMLKSFTGVASRPMRSPS